MSRALFAWFGLVLGLGSVSCGRSPDDFCERWVEETCTARAGCCESGTKFDPEQCRIELSNSCLRIVPPDVIEDGELVFDSDAARECFGQSTSCADPALALTEPDLDGLLTFDQQKACSNMLTGYLPPGSACTRRDSCERAGEFSECYVGSLDGDTPPPSICAKVVRDDETCSFSLDSYELHVCSEGKFCDLSGFKPSADDSPATRAFVFSAPCRDEIPLGESCINPADDAGLLACQTGLFCDVTGGNTATCSKKKGEGEPCDTYANQCADGLACTHVDPGDVCQPLVVDHAYCLGSLRCGDGLCQDDETATSCPQDCQGSGPCGDGICQQGEAEICLEDCCGDGYCEEVEATMCPQDCGS